MVHLPEESTAMNMAAEGGKQSRGKS